MIVLDGNENYLKNNLDEVLVSSIMLDHSKHITIKLDVTTKVESLLHNN